jgi:two-component system LytT family response regulator
MSVLVRECDNGMAALESIRAESPDVVFVDTRLPRGDGFSLLRHEMIDRAPMFVLMTNDDRDGLRAFTAGALDCIRKPLDEDRCRVALQRARDRIVLVRATDIGRQAAALFASEPCTGEPQAPTRYLVRLSVPCGNRSTIIPVPSIEWIRAEDCYSRIFVPGSSFLLRRTLGALERQLNPLEFVRTHRSAMVNVRSVQTIRARGPNEVGLLLRSGASIPISQRRRTAVMRCLEAIEQTRE